MMFNIFNIKLNKKGFTLMELVVSTAIMGTLAAVAVPAYMETSESAKGTKAMDTMNTIGSAIVNAYMQVADQGSDIGDAIAEFTIAADVLLATGVAVINYGKGAGASTVLIDDIFPSGIPPSPFGGGWKILVDGATNGQAEWTATTPPVLNMLQPPRFVLSDEKQAGLTATFQLTPN